MKIHEKHLEKCRKYFGKELTKGLGIPIKLVPPSKLYTSGGKVASKLYTLESAEGKMNRLVFTRKPCETEEYVVQNKKGDVLSEIAYCKVAGHKKADWWSFITWNPMDSNRDFWMGEDCHREIADFLAKLKAKVSPSQKTERGGK